MLNGLSITDILIKVEVACRYHPAKPLVRLRKLLCRLILQMPNQLTLKRSL